MESLERIKLLINYDNKKTLTENVMFLYEDAFTKLVRDGRLAATELEGVLKAMKADAKVAEELKTLKPGGIQTADDLLVVISGNKLSKEAKGFMNIHFLKSGTANEKLIAAAAEDLVKSPQFAQKYYSSWKDGGGRPGLEQALKNSGKYSDRAITNIVNQTEKNLANVEKLSTKQLQTTKTTSKDVKAASETATAEKASKSLSETTKNKIKEYLKNFKPNWKKLVKWGAGLGLSAAILWYFFKSDETVTPPVDTPPSPPVDNGGSGNTGGGGGGSSWQECPTLEQVSGGTASIDYGMSCDLVGEIQLKLDEKIKAGLEVLYKGKKLSGLKNDTKFGGRTKASVMAFQKQNGKTETGSVNKETYDLLFGTSAPNVTPAPPVKLDPRDEVDTTSDEVSDESGI